LIQILIFCKSCQAN